MKGLAFALFVALAMGLGFGIGFGVGGERMARSCEKLRREHSLHLLQDIDTAKTCDRSIAGLKNCADNLGECVHDMQGCAASLSKTFDNLGSCVDTLRGCVRRLAR